MRIIGNVVLVLVVIALSSVTRTVQVSVFISLSLREKRETKNDVFSSFYIYDGICVIHSLAYYAWKMFLCVYLKRRRRRRKIRAIF